MTPAELTRLLKLGAGQARRFRKPLQSAYAEQLRKAQAEALRNLERFSTVTASANWTKPDIDEIYNLAKAQGDMQRSTEGIRVEAMRAQVAGTLAKLGISFDLKNPLIQHALRGAGQGIVDITESQRAQIMSVVDEAWQDGLDLDATASAIESRTSIAGLSRSMRIARTEIVGIQNGGSVAAARISGVAQSKTWLTAPGARYPRHEEYDELDGQTVALDDTFTVGAAELEYPGDPNGPPEEIINCRCTVIYGEE